MKILLLMAAIPLAACSTVPTVAPQPQVVIKEVVVPGPPSPCVPKNIGGPPVYQDSDTALRAAKDAAERYRLMAAARPLRMARLNELEPVVASCPKEK
ncbi:hypothetical protein [Sphingomonas sp. TREG-RG-20F-R18-01]|uniref:hypothetical protein n=1 Tax=Sphingomonas sp. TREG-RG-20F-R18-01 TaxID=2914982 RepID=UPI001F561789|nr:hypothetical protein [Sphingomonas sp. TREG-RG-20F-R18-01]